MSRRLTKVAVVLLVALAAAQLVRPQRTNPATIPGHSIQAHIGAADGLGSVLQRACNDCHSNETTWPWYTQIAPLSWLMAYGVEEGRKVINFSEWESYSPERQQSILTLSCRDASTGKMPGSPYTLFHPDARLTDDDVAAICAVARSPEAGTTRQL